MSILDTIRHPADLRALHPAELTQLADEIRAFLIDKVQRTGGHLGPNLGVVELTIAVHRVFESPADAILFDTGHQAYVHKILTGRADQFDSLRRAGGLSGYPSRAESEHDWLESSHASAALSQAEGLSRARALRADPMHPARPVVAVVGDGALTGGMCWEALNLIAEDDPPNRRLVIVINDNGRSYAPTVGALATHLPTLLRGLGLDYIGPIDGHDIAAMELQLHRAAKATHPTVVHVLTEKGHGFGPAEADATDHMHSTSARGGAGAHTCSHPSPTEVFGQWLNDAGAAREDIIAVSAAMTGPTGMSAFAEQFPHRVVDVGIAEQHGLASAAGLARGGFVPVVAMYSTFFARAFDQLLMDVALIDTPMVLAIDRAGVTGPDGPSHNGMWDMALCAATPGMRLWAPRDLVGLRVALDSAVATAVAQQCPVAVRYPKGSLPQRIAGSSAGGVDILHQAAGAQVLIVAVGAMAQPCLHCVNKLADAGIAATVVHCPQALPVPQALADLAAQHRVVLTVEDGIAHGGVGAAVSRSLQQQGCATPVHVHGADVRFYAHASRDEVLAEMGLSADGIADRARRLL
ncbi:1-deoxy-D-xylulose-5-phosphate synthase [Corynebacterium sp. TAE3-ERU12]|uniref:1-deoxy-D-xylulose-5-phosphate synthase n=1 Tax=Corynebacterium sp. TAE3-ERU12 TaxID=2849491 RepID=UPI001C476C1D|nr:1-deoxy-D-xylulose-5-phosphate synthase [Corynebacterium sp. TAE3-ERU12]MBV7295297.1 1-deoxy-D-xylulose-5-phosphate synthase [Corynebacterium sp. TAE3-ERU12]